MSHNIRKPTKLKIHEDEIKPWNADDSPLIHPLKSTPFDQYNEIPEMTNAI